MKKMFFVTMVVFCFGLSVQFALAVETSERAGVTIQMLRDADTFMQKYWKDGAALDPRDIRPLSFGWEQGKHGFFRKFGKNTYMVGGESVTFTILVTPDGYLMLFKGEPETGHDLYKFDWTSSSKRSKIIASVGHLPLSGKYRNKY